MYTCANCTVLACANNEPEKMPKNCPMRNASVMEAARAGYDLPENHDFYVNCSAIEGLGYCQWPRLKETVEFCKRMGYHKLGLAFCKGLRKEARIVADLLRAQGFEVVSVICKTGGISKEEVGIPEEVKIHPGEFEAMCNPIAQAKLLNEQHTDFNIEVGLCVGHDSMFYKYSDDHGNQDGGGAGVGEHTAHQANDDHDSHDEAALGSGKVGNNAADLVGRTCFKQGTADDEHGDEQDDVAVDEARKSSLDVQNAGDDQTDTDDHGRYAEGDLLKHEHDDREEKKE